VSESVGNKQKRPFQGWWQSILTIRLWPKLYYINIFTFKRLRASVI
jgi:hypothetical protein